MHTINILILHTFQQNNYIKEAITLLTILNHHIIKNNNNVLNNGLTKILVI